MNKFEEIAGLVASLSGACIQYGFDVESKQTSKESFDLCQDKRAELLSEIKALHDENVALRDKLAGVEDEMKKPPVMVASAGTLFHSTP